MAKDRRTSTTPTSPPALPVSLTFNTTEYPYSLVAFRKGVSQAIDRNMVSKIGEYGYAPPTDRTRSRAALPEVDQPGAPGEGEAARRPTILPPRGRRSRTAASRTGAEAHGPEGQPGQLPDARDRRLVGLGRLAAHHLPEPAGSGDRRVRQDRAGLAGMGVEQRDQRHQAEPDLVERRWRPDAVRVLLSHFDPSQIVPTGQDALALGNFERNSIAPAVPLLRQFKGTLDRKKQLQAAYKLQEIFLNELPYIPLFIGPRWSTYSRKSSRAGSRGRTSTRTRSSRRSSRCRSRSCRCTTPTRRRAAVPALPNVMAT